MINNQDIVCISNTTWHGPYTKSTVQILSRLSRNNRVLFVEYPFTLKDVITTMLGKQHAPVLRMLGLKSRLILEKLPDGSAVFRLIVPPVLPFDFKPEWLFRILNALSVAIYRMTVKRAMKKLKMKEPILITAYNPFYGLPLIGKLNEKLNVYYCYDATDVRKHGQRAFPVEKEFCEKTDGIIVTSDHLHSIRKVYNPNCMVVKNGVEFELFHPYASGRKNKNEKIIVGYVGSIDDRFDLKTVLFAIRNRPGWIFEFTGDQRNQAAIEQLRRLENVRFHPAVKPSEVPRVMLGFSAGIIPYLKDDQNRNIYPLKINEYLAMGIPVVMTDFASLPEFDGLVSVAADEEEFLRALDYEITTDSEVKSAMRTEIARGNSWEARTLSFSASLEKLLEMKKKEEKIHG